MATKKIRRGGGGFELPPSNTVLLKPTIVYFRSGTRVAPSFLRLTPSTQRHN